jgi:RNA polymerase sigma-70 factor (ECF subfamily)
VGEHELARRAVQRGARGAARGSRKQENDGGGNYEEETGHAGDTGAGPAEVPRPYVPRVAERAWIRGAQNGSVADLERLFREHWPRAFRAARLVTGDAAAAEDIAQEAFLAAVRNLDRFDRRRPFAPWLHRIVVNRAIDWTRARRLRAEVELGDHLAAPPAPEPDGSALARIADLPPEHRAVVVLRYLLEYTPGEIAELLDLPRGTVNSRLRRGLDRMKDGTA